VIPFLLLSAEAQMLSLLMSPPPVIEGAAFFRVHGKCPVEVSVPEEVYLSDTSSNKKKISVTFLLPCCRRLFYDPARNRHEVVYF